MVAVEDLYLPYRPKRQTRASIAKERGLEPLADMIMLQQMKGACPEKRPEIMSQRKKVLRRERRRSTAQRIFSRSGSPRLRNTAPISET